jgi:imidazolonepropionase-like amidohydrolase
MGLTTIHFRQERPNLLDNLKRGDRFAFRIEADHRIGATKTSFHAYVPRADDPRKEDKFDAEFTPIPAPDTTAAAPVDNVKAMCDAHRFSPEQEKQYCGTAQELPVDQPTKN